VSISQPLNLSKIKLVMTARREVDVQVQSLLLGVELRVGHTPGVTQSQGLLKELRVVHRA